MSGRGGAAPCTEQKSRLSLSNPGHRLRLVLRRRFDTAERTISRTEVSSSEESVSLDWRVRGEPVSAVGTAGRVESWEIVIQHLSYPAPGDDGNWLVILGCPLTELSPCSEIHHGCHRWSYDC
jgi:hypothetical protein